MYKNEHVPVNVAVSNNFANKPTLIEDPDVKKLIQSLFDNIIKVVSQEHPEPSDVKFFPKKTQKSLGRLGYSSNSVWFQ